MTDKIPFRKLWGCATIRVRRNVFSQEKRDDKRQT
jgi:hypothetical protein